MLDDLMPRGLSDAAKELGVEPFEVVRLLVAAEAIPDQLRVNDELLETIRAKGAIETWWTAATPPEDSHPQRAWLRAGLQKLIDDGYLGGKGARMDNLWRGLPLEDQDFIQQALNILIDEGHLQAANAEAGILVSIEATAQDTIAAIAQGKEAPPALAALWG